MSSRSSRSHLAGCPTQSLANRLSFRLLPSNTAEPLRIAERSLDFASENRYAPGLQFAARRGPGWFGRAFVGSAGTGWVPRLSSRKGLEMFAIVDAGGHQMRVQEGEIHRIDYRDGLEEGAAFTFDRVLIANGGAASVIGAPTIAGASVSAEVVRPLHKGEKLEIGKLRRRKTYRRHTGHRQKYTLVKVTGISVPGLETKAAE